MNYPQFFDTIETITLEDDLSNFLGTFKNGIVEFSYLDIVKATGHSCPTVAGAYLVCIEGLKALYGEKIPKRGEIFISFKEDALEGTTGVIASVLTHITGATFDQGFKGLNGNFSRIGLMEFGANIDTNVKFTRKDTKDSVNINYDPSSIKVDPRQMQLMKSILEQKATTKEKEEFKTLWQQRVEAIFKNKNKVIQIA